MGIAGTCLKLELTESTIVTHHVHLAESLQAIWELGVGIMIDDFGTGYPSLSYLVKLPSDVLKIDRGFISDGLVSSGSREIVQCVIAMAKAV